MNEIKLSLSIELQGSTMFSKEECLKTTHKVIEKKTTNPEITTFHTRKCKSATQSLNMNKEAYEYMIDKDSCPSWSKPGKWAAMSEKERLEAHLQRTVEYLGGTSYTYQVFED